MKKIIDNKLYNTETATNLGGWSNGLPQSDFSYAAETLYRKKTGEFFLYGKGGPQTRYCSRCGDSWGYGEAIIPMKFEKAQKWAEEKLDADEYEKIFGEISEDGGKSVLTLYISTEVAEKTRREASKNGMSLSAYAESLLNK